MLSDVSCIIKRALYLLLRQQHVLCVTMLHLYNYLFTLCINAAVTFMDCAFVRRQSPGQNSPHKEYFLVIWGTQVEYLTRNKIVRKVFSGRLGKISMVTVCCGLLGL